MNNPQDNDFGGLYFIDEQPAHADRLSVNFCFCWDFPTLPKCQWVFLNAINGQETVLGLEGEQSFDRHDEDYSGKYS